MISDSTKTSTNLLTSEPLSFQLLQAASTGKSLKLCKYLELTYGVTLFSEDFIMNTPYFVSNAFMMLRIIKQPYIFSMQKHKEGRLRNFPRTFNVHLLRIRVPINILGSFPRSFAGY